MRKLLLVLLLLLPVTAAAQTGSSKTPTALNTETNTTLADNTTGAITPAILRQVVLDIIASYANLNVPNAITATSSFNGIAVGPTPNEWNFSYDNTQNFGSGSTVNALKICSIVPCTLPLWLTQYGFLNVGNVATAYPLTSPNGYSDTTGPAFGVVGDIRAGDLLYFGSAEFPIVSIANSAGSVLITYSGTPALATGNTIVIAGSQTALNNGPSPAPVNWAVTPVGTTQFLLQGSSFTSTCSSNCGYFGTGADSQVVLETLQGGFPSARLISPSQRNTVYNHDWGGGSLIAQCPDVSLVGINQCAQGEMVFGAWGSNIATGNDFVFQTRSATASAVNRIVITSSSINPGQNGTYDFGTSYVASGSTMVGYRRLFFSGNGQNLDVPSSYLAVSNGDRAVLYQDGSNKQSMGVDTSGNVWFQNVSVGAAQAFKFYWGTSGAGSVVATIDGTGLDSTVIGGTAPAAGTFTTLTATSSLGLAQVAFSGLPTCNSGNKAKVFYITDSATGNFNAVIATGSGGNQGMALCNGTNWTFH